MKRLLLLLIPALLITTACKKTEEAVKTKPVVTGPVDKVTGLDVKGVWVSQCLQDLAGIPSRKITMEYSEKALTKDTSEKVLTRTVISYNDRYCAQPSNTQVNTGKFAYNELHPGQVYTLEYWIDTGNGLYGIATENVRRDGSTLYISDINAPKDSVPQIPLSLQSGPSDVVQVPAHAPKAGDTAVYIDEGYQKSYVNQGDVQGNGIFTIFYTLDSATGPSSGTYSATANSLWSTAEFTITMQDCKAPAGVEEVVSVPAGKFQTCRVIDGDGYVWYGNIPVVGIVKQQKFDGTGLMELKSYTIGN